MFPISSSSTSTMETNWRTYYDAKRLIRQTEQRLNEARTIYPHVHLSTTNHYETIDNGHLSTSLSSNSFFHRSIYPSEERTTSHNSKLQSRDSEALQTIRRKINRQKLAAERRAEQLFHSQSDAGHLFDHYRPSTTNYSTSASLQNLHYSPHRQVSRPAPVPAGNHHHLTTNTSCLSQSQSFPSELDTVLRHSRGTSNRENEYPRTMASVVPKESLSYTNGRTSQQRSASASTGLATKYQDLPPSRLLTPTEGKPSRRSDLGKTTLLTNDAWRTDLLVTRKSSAKKSLLTDSMNKRPKGTIDDDEMASFNIRPSIRKELSNEKTPIKREKTEKHPDFLHSKRAEPTDEVISMEKRTKDKSKRSTEAAAAAAPPSFVTKRPSAFTPVTPKEFTEQTRHRLLRLLGSSTTDYYPSSTIDQTSSFLERSSSSSSSSSTMSSSSSSSSADSIIEVHGEKLNGRSRSEPPVSNGLSHGNGQRHDNLLRWAATLTRDCDLVENRFKYLRPDVSSNYDSTLQYDDGNLRYSSSNIRPSSSNETRIYRDRAAAKIQAAYRGYTVRKSLSSLNDKEKQLHSEFNQRPTATFSKVYPNDSGPSSGVSTPTNPKNVKDDTSSSVTPVPSPNFVSRRPTSPPKPTPMSPDNGRPLKSPSNHIDDQAQVHIELSLINNNGHVERKVSPASSSSTVKKRPSRSPALQPSSTRHRTSQTTSPPTSSSESILTAREKRIRQKFNSDLELQAYEKRLKDIEKKIRVLVKRAIEIFDEKRSVPSPSPSTTTANNAQRSKSNLSEDLSQHEKSKKESDTSSTRASSDTVTSDLSDLERRVHDYSEQLKAKKKELERLKRLKRTNKEILRRQENELIRQIESCDQQIKTLSLEPPPPPPQEQTVPSPVQSTSSTVDSHSKPIAGEIEIAPVPIESLSNGNLDEPDTPRDAQSFSTMTDFTEENKAPVNDEPVLSSASVSRSEPSPAISPPIDDHPKPSEIIRPPSPHAADYDEDFSDASRSQKTIPEGKILDGDVKSISEDIDERLPAALSNASVSSRSTDEPQSVILNLGEKSTPREEDQTDGSFPPPPLLLPEPINDETSKDTSEVHDDVPIDRTLTNEPKIINLPDIKGSNESTSGEETSEEDQPGNLNSDEEFDLDKTPPIDPRDLPQVKTVGQDDLVIDLDKLIDEPPEVPPETPRNIPIEPMIWHNREQVLELSHDALTILFNQNETFVDRKEIETTIPESYFQRFKDIEPIGNEDVRRSRCAYARMIFDLCVELLHEIYSPNVQLTKYPMWQKSKLITKRFYRMSRPKSRDETERLIQQKICEILGLAPKEIVYSKYRIPPSRRLDEKFELVLEEELRRTEIDWINYDDDSIRIKFDIAERIFEQLIDETLTECLQLVQKRYNHSSTTISTSA